MANVIANLLVKVSADIRGLERGLSSATGKLKSVGSSMTRMGRGLTLGLTAPLMGLGALAIKTATDFEQQMNILSVAAGDTGMTFEQLSKMAKLVGGDTQLVGITASEAADSMTTFYKAGLTTNEMFGDYNQYLKEGTNLTGAMRAAIDLAAASSLDLARASDLVVVTMSTFGLTTDEVTDKIGHYIQAADASVAEVEDFEAAMGSCGPVMAGFGFKLEEVNTLLAILSTRGIRGQKAGTGLRSMFKIMTSGSKKVAEALGDLNLSLYDMEGTMKPAGQIVKEFSAALDENAKMAIMSGGATADQAKELSSYGKKIKSATLAIEEYSAGVRGASYSEGKRAQKIAELTKKIGFYEQKQKDLMATIPGVTKELMAMTGAQRDYYIQTLAGAYGQSALRTLMQEGGEGYAEMEKKIAAAASMQEVAAARTRGLAAAWEQLKGVLEIFLIEVGTPMINFLTPMVKKVAELLSAVMKAHPGFAKWAILIGGVLAALGPLLMIVGGVVSAIGTIGGAISGLMAGGGLAAILGPLLPILPVILAIAGALALVFFACKKHWPKIVKVLKKVWASLKVIFDKIKEIVSNVMDFLCGDINFDLLKKRLKLDLGQIGLLIKPWGDKLKKSFLEVWERIKVAAAEILPAIGEKIKGVLIDILTAVGIDPEKAAELISRAWENIKTITSRVWEAIKNAISHAIQAAKRIIAIVVQAIAGDWEGAWQMMKDLVGGILGMAVENISILLFGLKGTMLDVWECIKSGLVKTWGVIKSAAVETWETITTFIGEKVEALKTTVLKAWDTIKGIWAKVTGKKEMATIGDAAEAMKQAEVWKEAVGQVSVAWLAMQETVTTIANELRPFIEGWLAFLLEKFTSTWEKINLNTTMQLSEMKVSATTIIGDMKWEIINILDDLVEQSYKKGKALARRFGEGIVEELQSALGAAERLAAELRGLLPGSDAKVGPLSDLFASGKAFSTTFAKGIEAGRVPALKSAFDMTGGMAQGAPRGGALGSSVRVEQPITIIINNPTGEPAEDSILRTLKTLAGLGVLEPVPLSPYPVPA